MAQSNNHPNRNKAGLLFKHFDRDGHAEVLRAGEVIATIDREPFALGGFIYHAYERPSCQQLYTGNDLDAAEAAINGLTNSQA